MMIKNKIINFYINRFRTPVIFKTEKSRYRLDLFRSSYLNYELDDLMKIYFDLFFINHPYSTSFFNHLYNYMFMHNEYFQKKLSLLKFFIDHNIRLIKYVKCNFLTSVDKFIFKSFGIEIEKIRTKKFDSVFFLLFRLVLTTFFEQRRHNKIYNSSFSTDKNKVYTKMISSWAIDEVDTVKEETNIDMNKTIIYLKPPKAKFILENKRKRLINFINFVRKKDTYDHFEYIPKLNFRKIFKQLFMVYFSSVHKHIKRSILGVLIQRQYYDDFVNYTTEKFPNLEEYYSNSVFNSFNYYLTEKLQEKGIKTINLSWILDIGCPKLKYDEFFVCSKIQKSFYDAPNTVFRYKKKKNYIIGNLDLKKPFALFFVHQCLFTEEVLKDSFTIKPTYKKIIRYVEKLAKENIIPVFAKYHPSSKEADKILSKNVTVVNDILELPKNFNYISLTYFSSYVITLLNKMPFFIINPKNKTSLQHIFPDFKEMYMESYNDLRTKIINIIKNPNYYKIYWQNLIEVMNELGF